MEKNELCEDHSSVQIAQNANMKSFRKLLPLLKPWNIEQGNWKR